MYKSLLWPMKIRGACISLLLTAVFFLLPGVGKAATISSVTGSHILITLTTDNELIMINSTTTGIVVRLANAGSWSGSVSGVSISGMTVTIGNTAKANFPEIRIVGASGKMNQSVAFEAQSGDIPFTNTINVELLNEPSITTFRGNTRFSGSAALSITTRANVFFYLNSSLTLENGDFTVSANMQATESILESGSGFSMASPNTKLEITGTGNVRITARGNGIPNPSSSNGKSFGAGISLNQSSKIITASGSIDLKGYGTETLIPDSTLYYYGIYLDCSSTTSATAIQSNGGDISLFGKGSATGLGIIVMNKSEITTTGAGNITLIGYGSTDSLNANYAVPGISIRSGVVSTRTAKVSANGTGNIRMEGYGGGVGTGADSVRTLNSGLVIGETFLGSTVGGQVLANGGEIYLKGVAPNNITNGNQNGVYLLGSSTSIGQIVSNGGKVTIEGKGTPGKGYDLFISGDNSISTETVPADIDLMINSFRCDNTTKSFVSIGAGKTLRVLTDDSVRINLGITSNSPQGTLSFRASDISNIPVKTGTQMIFGKATHSGAIDILTPITNPGIDLVFAGSGNVISPRAAGSDINTSVRPWALPANPIYTFRINGKLKDIGYDALEVTGGVNLAGSTLQLQGTYVPASGDTFVLVNTTTGLQGTFSNFQHGDTLQFNGKKLTVLYSGTQCRLAADGFAPSVQVTLTSSNNGTAVCPGTPITFNASALYGGTNPTFTFFKNNVQVKSGSDSTYTLNNPANGDAIRVILVSSVSGINPNRDTSNTISLTVKAATSSSTNLSICSDQLPYTWNGLTFSAAGSQTKTGLTNAAGCDSSATLNLTVKATTTSTTNLAICSSQLPYSWNGLTFNGSGSQTKTGLTNAAGCDSAATLNLTVKAVTSSSTNLAICPAQLPYTWNGLTFNAAGTQTKTGLTNAAGCDSSATLVLSVRTTDTSVTNLSICSAQLPYTWNGLTFNAAGTQTKTGLTGSTGCDSAATLVLTVKNPSSSTTNLAICDNDLPYVWNGLTFNGAGTQTKTGLVNAAGCDSSATLNLTLKNSTNSTTNLTICEGALPYVWNGLTFNAAGTQTKTGLTNAAGCDSSATLVLSVTPSTTSSTSLSICAFQLPYSWNGLTFNGAGTQTKTGLTNAAGCDSSATLVLSVYPAYGDTLVQDACVSYNWLGDTYTQTGFYQDTLISSVGCDSIVSLQLTIRQPNAVNVSDTACGSYFWNNLTYTNSGVYNATFTNQFGCDSVVTLSLTINPNLTPSVTLAASADTLCDGTAITFTATASNGGASPVYDFRLNGVSVQNGNTSTYTTSSLVNSDTMVVVLTANNACQTSATATSAAKVMTVNPILSPTVTLTASDDTICLGTAVTFTATATNPGAGALYEFYVNGTSVQGNTSNTYSSSTLANQDSVWVVLTPTNTCQSAGTVISGQIKMVVNPLPVVTLGAISDMAISADSVLLTFSPVGGTLTGPGISGNYFRPWTVDTGTTTISYSITNAQGCVASQSRTFNVQADGIVWDGTQWKYGTPGATQGSLDLMVLAGTSPAIPNGSACRNLVLRGGLLTHSLNNLLTINNNLNLRGGLMTGGGTLRFVNAASVVTATFSSNEFRADIEIPAGANLQNINAFRLAPGSNVMAGSGTPNGGGTTSGSWTLVQRGSTQLNAWNAFSSPVVNGTGRMIQGLQHFSFDVPSQAWQVWDSNLVMTNGRGYIARAATNGWFRGALNNGAIAYNVTKNASGSSWNLIGNPYPSQLSWSDFLAANLNINGTAYFMKSNVNVNNVVNDYTAINGLMIGAEIPVHQGFFVEANASGAINFTNAMRRAGRTSFYTRANQTVDLIWLKAFQQSDSAQASTTVVGFKADATTGFDRMYDGRLLKGDGSLFMYSLLNQEPMAIQGLPTLTAPVIVPLGIDANAAGTVVFRLDSTNMDPSVRILLEDLQTSTTHNLRQSAYQTQVAAGQNQSGRFRLLVNPFATTAPTIANNQPIKLYAFDQTLVIDELQGRKVKEVRLTDLSGRVIENWQQPQGESRIELPTTAANGVYLMTVITTDGTVQTERVLVRY